MNEYLKSRKLMFQLMVEKDRSFTLVGFFSNTLSAWLQWVAFWGCRFWERVSKLVIAYLYLSLSERREQLRMNATFIKKLCLFQRTSATNFVPCNGESDMWKWASSCRERERSFWLESPHERKKTAKRKFNDVFSYR